MKKLKVKLGDEKVYVFSTLTLREQAIARKLTKLTDEEGKLLDELTEESEVGELSFEKMEQMNALQDKQMDNLLQVLLISLQKNHPEFETSPDKITQNLDKLKDILDIRDVKRFVSFCMLGALPVEEENIPNEVTVIDLTK